MLDSLMTIELKTYATKEQVNDKHNPDMSERNSEAMTKQMQKGFCNPASASLKIAPCNLALSKFAPRISAFVKSDPERSSP